MESSPEEVKCTGHSATMSDRSHFQIRRARFSKTRCSQITSSQTSKLRRKWARKSLSRQRTWATLSRSNKLGRLSWQGLWSIRTTKTLSKTRCRMKKRAPIVCTRRICFRSLKSRRSRTSTPHATTGNSKCKISGRNTKRKLVCWRVRSSTWKKSRSPRRPTPSRNNKSCSYSLRTSICVNYSNLRKRRDTTKRKRHHSEMAPPRVHTRRVSSSKRVR
jgi:hypothetical protein